MDIAKVQHSSSLFVPVSLTHYHAEHQGMEYLHEIKVEHRDLKATNCLLDGDMRVKLADFGLSKSKTLATTFAGQPSETGPSGTITHMAPELLLENKFTEKCDSVLLWYRDVGSNLAQDRLRGADQTGNHYPDHRGEAPISDS